LIINQDLYIFAFLCIGLLSGSALLAASFSTGWSFGGSAALRRIGAAKMILLEAGMEGASNTEFLFAVFSD
jgi:hypothetical protein